MLEFVKCETDHKLRRTAEMASDIWHECFEGVISDEQIDYMVDNYQSFAAIKKQVGTEGYEYYNFVLDGTRIGYFAFVPQPDGSLFLSKLYMYKEYRGNGYASQAFRFVKELAKERGYKSIWLTVNRHNYSAIKVYEAFGMKVIREQVVDIGNGFVMDDFVYGIDL
jgi:ribosomal protein S18 acetylase RimI-like enzyme